MNYCVIYKNIFLQSCK